MKPSLFKMKPTLFKMEPTLYKMKPSFLRTSAHDGWRIGATPGLIQEETGANGGRPCQPKGAGTPESIKTRGARPVGTEMNLKRAAGTHYGACQPILTAFCQQTGFHLADEGGKKAFT